MSDDLKHEGNRNHGEETFLSDITRQSDVSNNENDICESLFLSLVQKTKKNYKDLLEVEIKLNEEKERRKQINSQFEEFLGEILEVLDLWEGVLGLVEENKSSMDKDVKNLIENFQQGGKLLKKKLSKIKVEHYAPRAGEPFIPGKQYCIGTEESDKFPEGVICKLVKKGYTWNGQLLRQAYVITVKNQ